ncbi:hypothetical protein BJX65DRAFT_159291 [Aspergillus insuetus]
MALVVSIWVLRGGPKTWRPERGGGNSGVDPHKHPWIVVFINPVSWLVRVVLVKPQDTIHLEVSVSVTMLMDVRFQPLWFCSLFRNKCLPVRQTSIYVVADLCRGRPRVISKFSARQMSTVCPRPWMEVVRVSSWARQGVYGLAQSFLVLTAATTKSIIVIFPWPFRQDIIIPGQYELAIAICNRSRA